MRNEAGAQTFSINDRSDLTLAVVKVSESGLLNGCTAHDQALIKTVVSELGTNIIKYAKRGMITLQRIESLDSLDIHIEANDEGPGIADIRLAMQDHYSTGNSLGLGLPSVKRLADEFNIASTPGEGTRVRVRKRIRGPGQRGSAMDHLSSILTLRKTSRTPVVLHRCELYEVAGYARAMPNELTCGDLVWMLPVTYGILLAMVDVSGHGDKAAALAEQIQEHLSASASSDLCQTITLLHQQLRGTQGAAIALLHVDLRSHQAEFCGVGNTGIARVEGEHWRPISKDGVLGHRLPTLVTQSTELRNGDLIVMWTDGLPDLAARTYAAKHSHLPIDQLSMDLVNALGRPFDDASCIVFRWIA